jgi:hypothetical protein
MNGRQTNRKEEIDILAQEWDSNCTCRKHDECDCKRSSEVRAAEELEWGCGGRLRSLLFFERVGDGGEAEGQGWVIAVYTTKSALGLLFVALGEEVHGGSARISRHERPFGGMGSLLGDG